MLLWLNPDQLCLQHGIHKHQNSLHNNIIYPELQYQSHGMYDIDGHVEASYHYKTIQPGKIKVVNRNMPLQIA